MVNKEKYMEVLNCIDEDEFLASITEVFENRDFKMIGNIVITLLLKKFNSINYDDLKKIICISLNYNNEKYQQLSHDELCNYLCKQIIGFQDYPIDELKLLQEHFTKQRTAIIV